MKKYKSIFKESVKKVPVKIMISMENISDNNSFTKIRMKMNSILSYANKSFTINSYYDKLFDAFGEPRKIPFSRSHTDDLEKSTDFIWFLYDKNFDIKISIWNYRNGPNYFKVAYESDEYEDNVLGIDEWLVWSNKPELAKNVLDAIL